jgi:hypothetical protein
MSESIIKFLGAVIWAVVFITVVCLFLGLPVWILWNLLMPPIFGLPVIGFWEAVGLNVLCSLLFKDYSVHSTKTTDNNKQNGKNTN